MTDGERSARKAQTQAVSSRQPPSASSRMAVAADAGVLLPGCQGKRPRANDAAVACVCEHKEHQACMARCTCGPRSPSTTPHRSVPCSRVDRMQPRRRRQERVCKQHSRRAGTAARPRAASANRPVVPASTANPPLVCMHACMHT